MMLPKPSKAVPVSKLARGESKKNELLVKGYPHHSYVQDPYTGDTGVVYPGDSTIYAPKVRGELHEEPEVLNRRYGVTPAQAAACCYGVMFGWDASRANPMAYNAAGEYMGV